MSESLLIALLLMAPFTCLFIILLPIIWPSVILAVSIIVFLVGVSFLGDALYAQRK